MELNSEVPTAPPRHSPPPPPSVHWGDLEEVQWGEEERVEEAQRMG